MKNLTKIFMLLAFIAITSAGCNKAKDLLDVKFDADFETNLNVDIPAETMRNTDASFYQESTIDPQSNTEFAEYGSKIKEIEIKEVKATILSINKEVVLETAEITVKSADLNPAVWSYTNETLTVGKQLVMDNSNGQWDNVQTILDGQNAFTVSMGGTSDQDDVQFTLLIEIKTSVTANPLN
ncbi:MAG: hypothetical protein KJ578_00660 [Bacteroidetes bacterium]|nr:hypothetical protein [Bacteroidota bacterium]MBU1580602.1 hypothetical protein [Bacteroidota bacterium]MBU2556271.1 hypothetical protein [Bacteroidota bacterium]